MNKFSQLSLSTLTLITAIAPAISYGQIVGSLSLDSGIVQDGSSPTLTRDKKNDIGSTLYAYDKDSGFGLSIGFHKLGALSQNNPTIEQYIADKTAQNGGFSPADQAKLDDDLKKSFKNSKPTQSLEMSVIRNLNITNSINFKPKFGVAYVSYDQATGVNLENTIYKADEIKTEKTFIPQAGAELSYNIMKNLSVDLNFLYLFPAKYIDETYSESIGISYSF